MSLKSFVTDISKEFAAQLDKKYDANNPSSVLALEIVLKHFQVDKETNTAEGTVQYLLTPLPIAQLLIFYLSCLTTKSDFPDLIPSLLKCLPKIFDRVALLLSGDEEGPIPNNLTKACNETISMYLDLIEGCFMDRSLTCFDDLTSSNQLSKFLILFQKTTQKVWFQRLIHIFSVLGTVFKEVNTSKSRVKYLQENKCLSYIWISIFNHPESLGFEDNEFQFESIQNAFDLMEYFSCLTVESHISSYVSEFL